MTGVPRSSGSWASRAAMTATNSASAFSTACDRRTWAAVSTPGGVRSLVGAPLGYGGSHRG
eukprot:9438449-Alexandrium_andersonii.AAC.1